MKFEKVVTGEWVNMRYVRYVHPRIEEGGMYSVVAVMDDGRRFVLEEGEGTYEDACKVCATQMRLMGKNLLSKDYDRE